MSILLKKKETNTITYGEHRLQDYIRSAPAVPLGFTCKEALTLFKEQTDCECIVICENKSEPVGLLMRHRFFLKLGQRYSADLYYERPVTMLMDRNPLIVNEEHAPEFVISQALLREEIRFYDCVLVVQNSRFAGVLTVSDLLSLSSLLQRNATIGQQSVLSSALEGIVQIKNRFEQVQRSVAEEAAMLVNMAVLTREGKETAQEAAKELQALTNRTREQEDQMSKLEGEAGSIHKVVTLIKELAEQSNLLSVNASIEAARAGEHGRGFAVVAEQVKKMASETKRAAIEIADTANKMKQAAEQAAHISLLNRQETKASSQKVLLVEKALDKLYEHAQLNAESSQTVSQLTTRSLEQTVAAELEMKKLSQSYENRNLYR